MFSALIPRLNAIKQRVPLLNQLHLNFIFVHYAYIISWVLISSILIYPGGHLSYTDALFQSSGAATQSGLNTVDINKLSLYQQIVLYFVAIFCTPIFIHSALVFIRLYWFEKRFQHVVRDARALRTTRSRMDTMTQDKDSEEINRAELGIGGRPIVVLRNNAGDARGHRLPDPTPKAPDAPEQEETPDGKKTSERSSSEKTETPRPNLSPEHHIAFLENQRKNKGALRIPSPREYDRGGVPEALEDGEDEEPEQVQQPSSPQEDRRRSSTDSDEVDQVGPLEGPHITINEPDFTRTRTRGNTFSRLDTRPTIRDTMTKDADDTGLGPVTTKNTFRGIFRSLTQERERPTQPYLSWNATVARNSNFVDLTEEQRDELGGIEYRALKTLAVVLISYYVGFHLFGLVSLVGWIMTVDTWGNVVKEDGVGRPWWGIFTSASAFNDLGFTLTPDSMYSFQRAIFPLLLMSFLIIIGNTGFPCMLRLTIWTLSKFARQGTAFWEELKFLLDHPRRCFTLLFPRNATWWLFAILVALNGIDLIFFIILDLNDPTVTNLPPGIRVLDGFFQAASTRTAGFGIVSLSDLHPAIQVSYLIMMYISVFPIAISMRRTNVYEEKSLGIYGFEDETEVDDHTSPSYIGAHLRRQLSFDLWYVFLGLFVIAIAEGGRLEDAQDYSFQLFTVLFEVVSAYGTVGLSFGYPGVNTSFSGQFNVVSKLVIIAMQIRGRHRGLPYALDRAVLLPSDALNRHEAAETERRMRRRASNLSGGESIGRPQSGRLSQSQADALSTGLESHDWQTHPAPNGDALVHRSSTVRSAR
ncbi:Low-affinity potassium transport protein [Penicillium canariense]|uniref:Potassium transport protein n=1 Tax=Penicillium canariense TaxID=189055 RepID=A0A9W9LD68_9EURO|nr:Low-affinity potassium transport protein [Penicillium canariense]KAJ5151446.1 Low-affinity potassium transport protein [Penicillium canariense]